MPARRHRQAAATSSTQQAHRRWSRSRRSGTAPAPCGRSRRPGSRGWRSEAAERRPPPSPAATAALTALAAPHLRQLVGGDAVHRQRGQRLHRLSASAGRGGAGSGRGARSSAAAALPACQHPPGPQLPPTHTLTDGSRAAWGEQAVSGGGVQSGAPVGGWRRSSGGAPSAPRTALAPAQWRQSCAGQLSSVQGRRGRAPLQDDRRTTAVQMGRRAPTPPALPGHARRWRRGPGAGGRGCRCGAPARSQQQAAERGAETRGLTRVT